MIREIVLHICTYSIVLCQRKLCWIVCWRVTRLGDGLSLILAGLLPGSEALPPAPLPAAPGVMNPL